MTTNTGEGGQPGEKSAWDRFKDLARKVVTVPKSEADRKATEEKARKDRKRG